LDREADLLLARPETRRLAKDGLEIARVVGMVVQPGAVVQKLADRNLARSVSRAREKLVQ